MGTDEKTQMNADGRHRWAQMRKHRWAQIEDTDERRWKTQMSTDERQRLEKKRRILHKKVNKIVDKLKFLMYI